MISREKLDKLLVKRLKKYGTSVEFVNDMHKFGLSRQACMILELLLLGRDYDRIMRVLLYTEDSFSKYIDEIYTFLNEFKKKQILFKTRTPLFNSKTKTS